MSVKPLEGVRGFVVGQDVDPKMGNPTPRGPSDFGLTIPKVPGDEPVGALGRNFSRFGDYPLRPELVFPDLFGPYPAGLNDISDDLWDNPFATLVFDDYPKFNSMRPEDFVPAVDGWIDAVEEKLALLETEVQPTWEGVMEALLEIEYPLLRLENVHSHLEVHKMTPEWEAVITEVGLKLVNIFLKIKQSRQVYTALVQLRHDEGKWQGLTGAQHRVVDHRLSLARLAGIELEGESLARFNAIEGELTALNTEFSKNRTRAEAETEIVITDRLDLSGLPQDFFSRAASRFNRNHPEAMVPATAENGPYAIGITQGDYKTVMNLCDNRAVRESVYLAFMSKASSGEFNNTPVVRRILQLRQEQAGLLGFANYAELSLSVRLAPSPQAVMALEDKVVERAKPKAEREMQEVIAFARSQGFSGEFNWWDFDYYAEKYKKSQFGVSDEDTKAYFPFPKVLTGMFAFYEKLLGITIAQVSRPVPLWTDEDVWFFEVRDVRSNELLGEVYYDPYARDGKYNHAWFLELRSRSLHSNGLLDLPLVTLNTNYDKPAAGRVPRLKLSQVEMLFHEFGHCLQGVLTTQDLYAVAGVSGIEPDVIEVASQALEYFLEDKATVLAMSEHEETGEPMPEELFDKILASKNFMSGVNYTRQVMLGLTDMKLHTEYDPNQTGLDPVDVMHAVAREVRPLPAHPNDNMLNAFNHIFDGDYNRYAAGYYGYLWADVWAADYFSAFKPLLGKPKKMARLGRRFRETLFSLGGSRDPQAVFEDFMGREPSVDAFLQLNGLI